MEKGAWTSALRALALEVMDRMILRHASSLVSDPRNGTINTFQGVREKLTKRKYTQFTEWRDDVMKVFQIARSKEDLLVNDVCTDLEQYFNKHYGMLLELSEFRFRTALTRVAEELNEIAQTTPVE
jgi:lipoate-protein ligase A